MCRAPSLDPKPTSPTTAAITVTPPSGGPWAVYNVTLCPVGGGTCMKVQCTDPNNCNAPGLTPSTTYTSTASTAVYSTLRRVGNVLLVEMATLL